MNKKQNRKSIAIREIAILIKNMKNNQFDSTITRENQQKHEIKIKKKIHEFFENLDILKNANQSQKHVLHIYEK